MKKSLRLAALLLAGATALPLAATAAPLTPAQLEAAYAALDDEYHAYSFYAAVIETFGPIRPFSNIIKAEQTHAARVIALLQAEGAAVPPNPYADGSKPLPAVPASKAAACAIGVQAEIANKALYDENLLPAAEGNVALTQIFTDLRDASQLRHLPAFQRCAG